MPPTTARWRAPWPFLHSLPGVPHRARQDTCRSGAIGADLIDLVGLRRHVPGPIIDEAKVTALVKGTAQVGLPLGRIGLVHPLGVLSCLLGPGLGQEEKTGDHREPHPSQKPLLASGSRCCAVKPSATHWWSPSVRLQGGRQEASPLGLQQAKGNLGALKGIVLTGPKVANRYSL